MEKASTNKHNEMKANIFPRDKFKPHMHKWGPRGPTHYIFGD